MVGHQMPPSQTAQFSKFTLSQNLRLRNAFGARKLTGHSTGTLPAGFIDVLCRTLYFSFL